MIRLPYQEVKQSPDVRPMMLAKVMERLGQNGEQDIYYSFITPPALTGIDDVPGNLNVSVYPNPTSGLLEISCGDKRTSIEIFTTVGKKVFSTSVFNTRHAIDISSQSAGIYFLKLISDDSQVMIKKIIRVLAGL